jgi:hypothetical protein
MCEALVGTASETCRSNDNSGFRSYNGSLWTCAGFRLARGFLEAVVLGAGTALSLLPEVLGIDAYRIWLQPRRLDRLYWIWQDGTALRKDADSVPLEAGIHGSASVTAGLCG